MRSFLLAVSIAVVVGTAFAQQTRSWGAWSSGTAQSGNYLWAATTNDSGHVLGQYCYLDDGNCLYLIAMSTSCIPGNRYPILVNSDQGSETLEIYCGDKLGHRHRYIFVNFDKIDVLVKKAVRVGFALPLQEDQFNVVRFDLRGSNEAIAGAMTARKPDLLKILSGTARPDRAALSRLA